MRGTALIVGDGWHGRNVLGAVRGLAAEGWLVDVAAPEGGLASSSRHVRHRYRLPSPAQDFDRFRRGLIALSSAEPYDVIFPGGDAELLAISKIEPQLQTCIPLPPFPQALAAMDKLGLDRAGATAGFTPLGTRSISSSSPLAPRGPVVVKARWHWAPGYGPGTGRLDAVVTGDPAIVAARVREIEAAGAEATIQEAIDGEAIAYVAIIGKDGSPIVEWKQRGIGHWPTPAGVWTRVVTLEHDEDFARRCRMMLRDLGWFGLVQLQFLVPPDGQPRLIDLNGRFYASLALPISAGINVPVIWAEAALGRQVDAPDPMPPGRRYQWLEGDLLRAVHERRGGLVRDIADTVGFRRGSVHGVWRRDDPRPTLGRMRHLAGRLIPRP